MHQLGFGIDYHAVPARCCAGGFSPHSVCPVPETALRSAARCTWPPAPLHPTLLPAPAPHPCSPPFPPPPCNPRPHSAPLLTTPAPHPCFPHCTHPCHPIPGPRAQSHPCTPTPCHTPTPHALHQQMHLDNGNAFLMAARKRKKSKVSSYVLSQDLEDLKRDTDNCLAKVGVRTG